MLATTLPPIDRADRDPEFRRLLGDYARDVSDPRSRALFEAETVAWERERGVKCTFLHPKPGFVVKTANLRTDEKTFLNVCSDPAIPPAKPKDEKNSGGGGSGLQLYGIPYSVTKQDGKGVDKSGRPCSVYDVVFHPDVVERAMHANGGRAVRDVLAQTALDAVEGGFDGVRLERQAVKFPKMKFKGRAGAPTVIREKIDSSGDRREPKYKLVCRHRPTGVADYCLPGGPAASGQRPTELQVDVELPEFESAAGVDLDVTADRLVMTTEEPVRYRLELAFPYPVDSEAGAAKFHKQERRLAVTIPVRPASEVRRLESTDSGYGGGELDHEEPATDAKSKNDADDNLDSALDDDPDDLMFPPYSCKIYEDLMVLTLDVKKVDESSVERANMLGYDEAYGFSIKFTSIGRGFVPFRYGFYCAFVIPGDCGKVFKQPEPEVEVWDNNLIVKVSLPRGVDCQQYRVGSSPRDLTIYALPQLHRAFWKRQQHGNNVSCFAL